MSIRAKLLIPVMLGGATIFVVGLAGLSGVDTTVGQAKGIVAHDARPLSDFAQLRDNVGDSRWEIRDFVFAPTAAARQQVAAEITQTDSAIDSLFAAYQADMGATFASRHGAELGAARAALQSWRAARNQAMADANEGRLAAAQQVVAGPLTQIDNAAFSSTFDDLFGLTVAQGAQVTAQADRSASSAQELVLAAGILGTLISLAVGLGISGLVVRPVRRTSSVLEAVADHDLTPRTATDSEDELGRMARALNSTLDTLAREFSDIGDAAHRLNRSAGAMTSIGADLAGSAELTAGSATTASSAASEVSENVGSIAAAAEQIRATNDHVAALVHDVDVAATAAVTQASEANQAVAELVGTAGEIGRALTLIAAVAEQTNLLALNATIESARAGDAGKGFAVVAGEVKDLAAESARVTGEIERSIAAIQAGVANATKAIGLVTASIDEISSKQGMVAGAIGQQSQTVGEIAVSARRTAQEAGEIAGAAQQVAESASATNAIVEQTGTTAQELTDIARRLDATISSFRY